MSDQLTIGVKHRSPGGLVVSVESSGMSADPALTGEGFVQAGRMAYQAGRIPARADASASSPPGGVPGATPAA